MRKRYEEFVRDLLRFVEVAAGEAAGDCIYPEDVLYSAAARKTIEHLKNQARELLDRAELMGLRRTAEKLRGMEATLIALAGCRERLDCVSVVLCFDDLADLQYQLLLDLAEYLDRR